MTTTEAITWTEHYRPETWWTAATDDASAEICKIGPERFRLRVWRGSLRFGAVVEMLERAQELGVELMCQ